MMFSKKHVEALISRIVKEEVGKALAVSDKRRKEFKDTFGQVFTEGDAAQTASTPPTPDPNAPPAPPGADPGTTAPGADATAGAPGTPPGGPGAPDPTGSAGGEPGTDGTTEDEPGADGSAPGSGGGFGGFGGGGGGGGDPGDGGEPGAEDDGSSGDQPDEPQGDPIASMVSSAQELLNQTNDPNLIMKSLKGQMQTVFAEPEHALGLIKALYDTQDSILQAVAQRLYLFLKLSKPS